MCRVIQPCANSCTYTITQSASLYHIQLMVAGETGQSGADVTKSVVEGSSSGCAAAIILLQSMEGSRVLGVSLRRGAATLIPALWTVNGRSGQSGPLALQVVREAQRAGPEPTSKSPCMEGRSAMEAIWSRENATNTSVLVRNVRSTSSCKECPSHKCFCLHRCLQA